MALHFLYFHISHLQSDDGHDTDATERLLVTFVDLMTRLTLLRDELERDANGYEIARARGWNQARIEARFSVLTILTIRIPGPAEILAYARRIELLPVRSIGPSRSSLMIASSSPPQLTPDIFVEVEAHRKRGDQLRAAWRSNGYDPRSGVTRFKLAA